MASVGGWKRFEALRVVKTGFLGLLGWLWPDLRAQGLGGAFGGGGAAQEDAEVLAGGDEVVLHLEALGAAPPGSFEAVLVGGVREAGFDEVLAATTVPPGGGAGGLSPRCL
jgi:hypothetical protein